MWHVPLLLLRLQEIEWSTCRVAGMRRQWTRMRSTLPLEQIPPPHDSSHDEEMAIASGTVDSVDYRVPSTRVVHYDQQKIPPFFLFVAGCGCYCGYCYWWMLAL